MPALAVGELQVHYPRFDLGPLDLEVDAGERVALIGKNGAGKSTFMGVAAGHRRDYTGSVRSLGRDPAADPVGVKMHVGFLPERVVGFGWMTVAERLRFLSAFYPTWDPSLERELVERLELDAGARVGTLSKGNKVKLALAAALAHRPALLLLDEPTSGIDPFMRSALLGVIREVQEESASAVILSTHILEDARAFADRALLLDRGKLAGDIRRPGDARGEWVELSDQVMGILGHA